MSNTFARGIGSARAARSSLGLPGSFPTFIVDRRYVAKLFGELFDGGASALIEREMYALLATNPQIPAPALVADGQLFSDDDGWPWPIPRERGGPW